MEGLVGHENALVGRENKFGSTVDVTQMRIIKPAVTGTPFIKMIGAVTRCRALGDALAMS